MTTITTSSNFRRVIAVAMIGALASSLAAVCTAADGSEAPQATVKFADLNVTSTQGAATLYSRIRMAANLVCLPLDNGDLKSKKLMDNCIHKAIADAVARVDQPALYSVYNAKNKTSRPIMLASGQPR